MPTSRAFDKAVNVDHLRQDLLASTPLPHHTVFEAQFASFATTIQQRIDADCGGSQTLSGSLSAQVERAVSQAMRRGNLALAAGGSGGGNGSGYNRGPGAGYGSMPGNPGVSQYATTAGSRMVSAGHLLPVQLPPPPAVLAREVAVTPKDPPAPPPAPPPMF